MSNQTPMMFDVGKVRVLVTCDDPDAVIDIDSIRDGVTQWLANPDNVIAGQILVIQGCKLEMFGLVPFVYERELNGTKERFEFPTYKDYLDFFFPAMTFTPEKPVLSPGESAALLEEIERYQSGLQRYLGLQSGVRINDNSFLLKPGEYEDDDTPYLRGETPE